MRETVSVGMPVPIERIRKQCLTDQLTEQGPSA